DGSGVEELGHHPTDTGLVCGEYLAGAGRVDEVVEHEHALVGAEIPRARIAGVRDAQGGGLSPRLDPGSPRQLAIVDIREVGLRLEVEKSVDRQVSRPEMHEQ